MPEDNRSIVMAEVMTPEKANFAGNIHGGHLLSLLDRVAYACASRYAGCYVVTLSVDKVLFKQAIHVGELVTCSASVNHVGKTSMEIGIKVEAENLLTGERRHTNTCYFTMVAVDENLKPQKIRSLELRNFDERRRFHEAEIRKEMRQQFIKEHERRRQQILEKLKNSGEHS